MGLGVLLLLHATTSTAVHHIRIEERTPIDTVILAPAHELPKFLSRAGVASRIDRLLAEHTDLAVRLHEEGTISDRCPEGGVDCLSRLAQSKLLVVLSLIPIDETHARLSSLIVDAATGTVLTRAAPLSFDAAGAEQALRSLVHDQLREKLEQLGHWHPYGSIELRAETAPQMLSVDHRPIGQVRGPRVIVGGVRPGPHQVSLSGEGRRVEADVEVKRAETSQLELFLGVESFAVEDAMQIAGLGTAAIGVGAVIAGLVRASTLPTIACSEDADCGGVHYARASGIPLAPVGWSLVLLGATWFGGSYFEDTQTEWMAIAAGVAIFAASAAVSLAIEGEPFDCTRVQCP